jgi:hypothetical protein
MPRDGANVYTQPFPDVAAGTTIASAVYNGFTHDVAQDLNTPRPIVAGGTGASDANTALFNMGAEKAAQVVTNYDAQLWIPGSFYSATTATGEPVDGHAFAGVAYINEPLANPPTNQNVVLEARDITDGRQWVRRKTAGTWGAWTLDGDLTGVNAAIAALALVKVDRAGDTMTGPLVLPAAAPTLGTHATNKTYVDGLITPVSADVANRVRYDAAQGLTTAQQAQARANISAPFRSYLAGLTLSATGASATFGISAGEAADSTNAALMQLPSNYSKTTSAWAVGSTGGGLDTGALNPAGWYHVFLMRRPDTGVVDVCFSTSPTAPTTGGSIPSAYTQFRRIGSILTASSVWVGFSQIGDEYLWLTRVVDVPATGMTTSAVLHTLSVPPGVQVNALFSARANYNTNAGLYMLSSPDETDFAPTADFSSLTVGPSGTTNTGHFNIRTNTSRQIRGRANTTVSTIAIATFGWIDRRGRDG